jgi:hypothetical protein
VLLNAESKLRIKNGIFVNVTARLVIANASIGVACRFLFEKISPLMGGI